MRLSRYFLPVLKETPAEAQIVSHRLMLRAGLVRQHAAGIYNWLPLGHRVLRKVEQIVREEQDRAGAIEMLMPTVQTADVWRESGRYDDYGREMLRIVDRHDREMLYGPTHEEVITDVFRSMVRSYKDLPKTLYQIQWKFRDEVRPRFGVMRGREFLMKDAYSFDLDEAAARRAYNRMFVAYLRTFDRLGVRAIPMRAATGPIGGNLSHEFLILADTGESGVFVHRDLLNMQIPDAVDFDGDLQPLVDSWTGPYAATDEMHAPALEASLGENLVSARGIEVGHIFYFGTKYSAPMGCRVAGPDGQDIVLHMGSYGIGVSRLVGAIIESSHDENGIIWPESVAPFRVALINIKPGDPSVDAVADALYADLRNAGVDVLYDDRADERAGAKFATADLIGLPWHVTVGPKGVAAGYVELKCRRTGEKRDVSVESVLSHLTSV
ncbi:proline--tRNA ligase [Haematospirillum jordaniae]|uniref:Proline--tRNA ligase n=1 Tax=Haematospirillum jordaniae TaxID=1549855 RepID=A0A143DFM2_9PROT|nr:proline--tRNA ligase [Haematospirillum jordaniae]AMW35083.1 proline--tRNA ligase [Haematospirillum jordaniae]NKD44167.1 proline--tRNA ligase [Haematospirillum jordaniae]NKD56545.1 proline--tRNA ligase [Haematospirillum jordaniae]NKD58603.1 proline--tRNA ligase [Haematospirillum jordaniae]NKD66228.1 proline--tRNA ligase [Haematospirillum jordaniae]